MLCVLPEESRCSFCYFICALTQSCVVDAAVYMMVMMINLCIQMQTTITLYIDQSSAQNYYGKINQINLCISCAAFYWNQYALRLSIWCWPDRTTKKKPNRIGITNNGWAHRNLNRRPEPVKRIIYNVANAIMFALLITLRLCLDLRPALVLHA